MASTYTRARERTTLMTTRGDRRRAGHLAIIVTSWVSALALLLCYAGRMRALDANTGVQTAVLLDANRTAEELLPATRLAFDATSDATFAAAQLASALRAAGGSPSNVGALTRLEVSTEIAARTRGLVVYAERARAARQHGTASPSLRLFTAADVARMKPALVVRTPRAHALTVLWCVIGLLASFQAISMMWMVRGVEGDRVLLAAVHLLVTLGALAMLSRPDPLRDTILLTRYTEGVVVAAVACGLISLINLRAMGVLQLNYLALAGALLLALALALFGSGPGTSGAKVNLGPWQPVEFIRLLLVVFLAGYLGRRWELLRQVREETWRQRPLPRWLHVPRLEHLLPMLGGVGLALALFFALHDLGPALLISLLLLLMLSVARAGAGALLIGLVLLAGGFYAGYVFDISRTLTARVAMWQSPWENAVRGGDQVAHAAWAMATGAITGTGPGLGDTRYLPAGHTDLVLAAIGEELGLVGLLVVALAAAALTWRGLRIARSAGNDGELFLALGLTLSLVLPMLVMAAGILGLLPLTGIVTPFLSYGGSAMVANFVAIGLLAAIGARPGGAADSQPFQHSLRAIGAGLAVCGVVIAGGWVRLQAAVADETLVRPQLSRQADGGLRYQYNPRVLDAARTLPRGAIRDRREVPLAANGAAVSAAAGELDRMQLPWRDACAASAPRCYPLGGRGFHLVGDVESRLNWAATNTSYVERDAESRLRGFDDRATSVDAEGVDESPTLALKRDYRELVPLVRHRWQPSHRDVVALRSRPRDLELTIDARLQMHVSSIVARAAVSSGVQKAAVVVVDAETGELLASVSYPWPDAGATPADMATDSLLDRARYGLYPPGSTFKLVTAAAALRLDPSLSRVAFSCSRLPDHRVGVRIPGARPVRDDVTDRVPHGSLTLGDGIVHSCNAYFAQLAMRLGTEPLARTAHTAGMIFPDDGPPARLREQLPHAAYGQGEVLTTPLRMARVAAAIASDGMIREAPVVRGGPKVEPRLLVPAASARLLAGFMREAVMSGTGRVLRSHPGRIAGKTGTAEVDDAASHSWFVGFAPAGPSARRIAFAVILENAGYGGGGAASVAGQVVTSAAALELFR
jgi:cell division protein FtsW (lipid II flippase)